MVSEKSVKKKKISRSGKCQGILISIREILFLFSSQGKVSEFYLPTFAGNAFCQKTWKIFQNYALVWPGQATCTGSNTCRLILSLEVWE